MYPRSFWLEQALRAEPEAPIEPLRGRAHTDVCIVGGGYAGLWTAIQLKASEPSLDVTLIERDLCGSGASGRNAGYLLSWWSKYLSLEKLCGSAEALRVAIASDQAVDAIPDFCAANGIDAHIRRDGWLWSASNVAQVGLWKETISAIERHGYQQIVEWPKERAAMRCGSPVLLGGAFESHAASVQPALLARGLFRVARAKGVKIFEKTPLTDLCHGNPAVVKTPHAEIRAERVVLTVNAWAAKWSEIRKSIIVVSGDMIVTPPIPQELDAMGWKDSIVASDGRTLVEYYRTTADKRLAFGKGGMSGKFTYGGNLGAEVEGRSEFESQLLKSMHQTFPLLSKVPVASSWRGPIDRTKSGLPFFHRLGKRGNVMYGVGFSGNGIGPCYIAGKILSAMALDCRDEWSTCPLVRAPERDFPPEPLRWLGSGLVRRAFLAKDRADDENKPPPLLARIAAGFAPAGLTPFKKDIK